MDLVAPDLPAPAAKADPAALRRLEVRAAELLARARHLNREKNDFMRRMF